MAAEPQMPAAGRRPEADGPAVDDGYWAISQGLAALETDRDVVRVAGPDAERYLQGQLSQDVAALAPGAWGWSLVLQPQGKLDALVRVYRVAAEEFLLDTEGGMGEGLVERLMRFRLRTRASVELLEWKAISVRGPAAVLPGPEAFSPPAHGGAVAIPFEWGGLGGYDLVGPGPEWPAEATKAGPLAYEAARIEAGFPRHGAELDERTIPAEAGLVEAAVSFTKGCYTGQELVARIDSRGNNVPRNLRGLRLSGPAHPGALLYPAVGLAEASPASASAKEAGRLTSVARSPRHGWVALGYVGRSVTVGQVLAVGGPHGTEPGPVPPSTGAAAATGAAPAPSQPAQVPPGEVVAEVVLLPFGPTSA